MAEFVKVGKTILNIDMITAIGNGDDGRAFVAMANAGEDNEWWFKDQDADDIRALFANVKTARQMVADREAEGTASDYEELLMLLKEAADIIRGRDHMRAGGIDEWLARASHELGVPL